jgi:hypothetical protein
MLDFGAMMEPVARELWGEPNNSFSSQSELRWGSHGARMVRLDKGTWADHEGGHTSINAGGVLDLIGRETGLDHKGAFGWLREHGYDVDDDRRRPASNGHDKAAPLGKAVAHYDYVDEAGALIFQVVRFEPKAFRQRRRPQPGDDPAKIYDGWVYSARGVRQVPYRLPEVTEAIALDHTVYIVEGEKDADNLIKQGVPATCNAGGVGKWRFELSEFFHGGDVVILQDNDPQARNPDPPKGDGALRWHPDGRPVLPGQDHAQEVARQMALVAARVRVLDLAKHWRDMPLKGDVSDWFKAGGTADKLYALAEHEPIWNPAPFRSRFGGLRWEQIGSGGAADCYQWYIEDVVPAGEIVLIFGDSGSGKSFDAFDMAMASARGHIWNGFNVEPGLNIYVAAEAGKGFGKRKLAYVQHHKLDPAKPLPLYLVTKRPNFFSSDEDVIALIDEIKAVRGTYADPLVAIYLDTLSALAPGMNENASQDVSLVRMRLERLREAFGVAVILVHHKPKGGSTPRGHGSLTADFETTIEFEKLFDMKDARGLPVHRATVRKQREGKSGIAWQFTLPAIEVGRNKWGNPETSCVVVPFEPGTKLRGGFKAKSSELLFLHALFEALESEGMAPPPGLPRSIHRAVDFKYVREQMRQRMIDPDGDERAQAQRFRTAFSRAGKTLRDGKVIGVQDPLVWYTGKPVQGLASNIAPASKADEAPEPSEQEAFR